MAGPEKVLRFVWWNLQSFAHFEKSRAGESRWPEDRHEYEAKCERVDRALRGLVGDEPPEILAFGEITNTAVQDLRDRLFHGYEVHSLDLLPRKPELQVAFLYAPFAEFQKQPPVVVPNVPRGTRPMAVLDYRTAGHRIRFFGCHWTARLEETSEHTRSDIARFLGAQIYEFLEGEGATEEKRHAVVLGDLNEEPYGIPESRLYATRDRARSRMRRHYTDKDVKRVRLYNCAWRFLGEQLPHNGSVAEREAAGTYYWREKKTWHTFDQVIVSGTLLTETTPFLDEERLAVGTGPELLGDDQRPLRFTWVNGRANGVSDHLPIYGRIVLQRGD